MSGEGIAGFQRRSVSLGTDERASVHRGEDCVPQTFTPRLAERDWQCSPRLHVGGTGGGHQTHPSAPLRFAACEPPEEGQVCWRSSKIRRSTP
jgi:hypothetical protein